MPLFLSGTIGDRFNVWELEDPITTIGRSSKHGIQIVDATVSKDHAQIAHTGDRWVLSDLGSRNGTRVNGNEIHEPTPIHAGDRVEIGHVPLRLTAEHPHQPTRLSDSTGLRSSIKLNAEKLIGQHATPSPQQGNAQLMHLLADAGKLLVLLRPLKETCDEILKIVEKAVPASRLVLLLKQKEGAEPVQIAARNLGGSARAPLVLSRAIMRTVLEENTSVITTDASADPRYMGQQSIVAQAVHSAMAVPLFDNEKVLGLLYADLNNPVMSYTQEHLELLTLVANMAAIKITNARLLEAEQEQARVRQELATATRIQQSLLPADPPNIRGYCFHAFLQTCYEVGGDLYDFHRSDSGLVYFLLGDVSGKGMGAALLMSSVLASARVLYDACPDPGQLVTRLSAMLQRSTESRHFVTAFIGALDPATGTLRYVNAGHPPPVLLSQGAKRELDSTGLPIGVLPDFSYTSEEVSMAPGDLLTVFSDGIPEAQRGDDFFEDRFNRLLAGSNLDLPLDAVSRKIMEEVEGFLDGSPRGDDITLVLVRRES
jgi:serine phosphatase RsbU (regulator of sigma subunit)